MMIGAALMVALGLGNAAAASLSVDVQVIEASNESDTPVGQSVAIRDLGATLSYKSFRTLSREQRDLAVGQGTDLHLPDGAVARISALGVEKKNGNRTVRLRVRIEQGQESLDTEYSVRDGGTVFVSAGKHEARDAVLVLAIAPHVK
jgi:hypothetical protein